LLLACIAECSLEKSNPDMNTNIVSYYRDRAEEYEQVYAKPERQDDLATATKALQTIFAGKKVLEIACGTGYWTERIAQSAVSIYATDINETVINVAKRKDISNRQVSFGVADINNFPGGDKYESLFGGFIWSHIKLQDIGEFIRRVNSLVIPGGIVVFMDNNFVENSNLAITNTDENGNTYQTRQLENGTTHLVLKNFPSEISLRSALKNVAGEVRFISTTYFWILSYRTLAV
jgi:ubiquinone/menaquinone biosynthesis C-methylase UbiE